MPSSGQQISSDYVRRDDDTKNPRKQIETIPALQTSLVKRGRPRSRASIDAYEIARDWLLDEGEDLQAEVGKQAACEKHIADELLLRGQSLSESTVRKIVTDVAQAIAQEKKAGKAGN